MKQNPKRDPVKTGKFLSLILRHQPETIGITLDSHGWADVEELINGVNKTGKYFLDREFLDEIVETNNKKRYSYNEDKTKIRANQGHSVSVDVELKETEPPEYLYHGTAERFTDSIRKEGLQPMSRLYVHLSKDKETALNVGTRHGKPHIFRVQSGEMFRQGYAFYLSVNGVWLTANVPPKFLEDME